jgi:hypothetical protein
MRHEYLAVTRRIRRRDGDAQSLAVAPEKSKSLPISPLIQGIYLRSQVQNYPPVSRFARHRIP